MPTKFLLDLKVLDDRFSGSPLYAEIDAEQIAVVDAATREYQFFQENVSITQILSVSKYLDLAPRQEQSLSLGYSILSYQKATLYFFLSPSLNPSSNFSNHQVKEQKLLMYGAWYAYGKFLKGDAEQFKQYGVKIIL